ncbi:MAG: DUF935 family protein [Acidobacteria bacterium]|nr:DUF935 family protein [Acidobacteriota bacterium]
MARRTSNGKRQDHAASTVTSPQRLGAIPRRQRPGVDVTKDRRDLFAELSWNRHRSGFVTERLYNPDDLVGARGLRIYAQMQADDQVKAALTLKKQAVLSTGWDLEPASDAPEDAEVAEFCQAAFDQMEGTLDDDLYEVMSALAYGYSVSELVYRPMDRGDFAGKIGLKAIKTRMPHDFYFNVDRHDNLLPDGIEQFGRRLPADKFVVYSYGKEFDNWYGTSDLRAAYRPWWHKDNILKYQAIFLERYSIPFAEGIVQPGATVDDAAIQDLRTVLENLQASTSLVHPNDITLAFPAVASAQGAQIFVAAIRESDLQIARAILLPNLLGVSAQGDTGSFSQARKHFDVFILIVEKIQRELSEHVMGEQIIRRLVDLNYDVEDYPLFTFLPFTETDKSQLLSLWYQAIAAGAVNTRPEDEVHVRSITEFPDVDLETLQAEHDAREAQAQAGGLGGGPFGGEPGGLGPAGGQGGVPGSEGQAGEDGLPSEEDLDALVDEVLGAAEAKGGAGHRLADRVKATLKGKRFATAKNDKQSGERDGDDDKVSEVLARLETEHPEWDDDALVDAAVAALVEGSDDDRGETKATERDTTVTQDQATGDEAALDALVDEIMGDRGGVGEEGEGEDDLDRLIDEVLAAQTKRTFQAVPLLKEGETLQIGPEGQHGVWRNIGGNPIFIEVGEGESVPEAIREELGKRGGAKSVVDPTVKDRPIAEVLAETLDPKVRKAVAASDPTLTPQQRALVEDTEERYDRRPGEGSLRWAPERRALHDQLLADTEQWTPSEARKAELAAGAKPELVLVMGGPGSGKTRTVQEFLRLASGSHVLVNPDDFKYKLPEFGAIASDDGIWQAAGATTHEESSYLSKELMKRAFARKADIVFDGTLSNMEKAEAMMGTAKQLGYRVSLHYIEVPPDVGLARIRQRAEGTSRERRRYVPESFARAAYGATDGSFERLKHSNELDAWSWYRVPSAGSKPERVARGGREFPTLAPGASADVTIEDVGRLAQRRRPRGRA